VRRFFDEKHGNI